MKVIILAGGLPSTISDVKNGIPKPMAEIGGRPLLWHIMKQYAHYGFSEFIVCGGYKVNIIKEYFKDFYIYQSDITVDLASNEIIVHHKRTEDWKVTVVDTGLESTTSQRILQVKDFVKDEPFFVTYGDCLSDIDMWQMAQLHKEKDSFITMAVAKPTGRHSFLSIGEDDVLLGKKEAELSAAEQAWVNASCYIFSVNAVEALSGEELNEAFMKKTAEKEKVHTYRHHGFWRPVETMRDSVALETLWEDGKAPWKVWEN